MNNKKQFLSGSQAIAQTIKNLEPAVISAYPITPQTHIVEDLAKFKDTGKARYEYVRSESEFAAASIVLGASATGVRTYSATSSQGLLLMTEVLFNISGLRLPVVMTVANRAVSAPINIWNDHSDIMAVRESGSLIFFAETHQEAIDQHIIAYKVAEQLGVPALINVDGFIFTHSYSTCLVPDTKTIKKFLPQYKPAHGTFLNPTNPATLGSFVGPEYYSEIRKDLNQTLLNSAKLISKEYKKWKKVFKTNDKQKSNGLIEYYGPKNPKKIIIAMGTVAGTIKSALDSLENNKDYALIKVTCYRPFPADEIKKYLKNVRELIAIDKSLSLGFTPPLYSDLRNSLFEQKIKISSAVLGLGGEDISEKMIIKIIKK